MGLHDDPPFDLGQTLGVSSTDDGKGWVGAVKVFTDVNPRTGQVRSNRLKRCIAVRNVSTVAILPKKLVTFKNGTVSEVDGFNRLTDGVPAGVSDEYLPSTGAAVNDVFWVTVDGPTEVSLGVANEAALGTTIVGLTAAASTDSATAGRAQTSANTLLIPGYVGIALSAGTTAQDILVNSKFIRS
jgi:hypothetical protein